jgi:hypothetical protein
LDEDNFFWCKAWNSEMTLLCFHAAQ